jgi:hypothetical protein
MMWRDRTRLIVGSIGLGLVLAGILVFLEQMYHAIQTGRLESVPLGAVLNEPAVRSSIPATVVHWLQQLSGSFHGQGIVEWLLDDFPLALFLALVGGVAAWRSLLHEPPPSRKR